MKAFLGVALSALVLAAPVFGVAQTINQPANSEHPYAVLDYQDGVHLKPAFPLAHRQSTAPVLRDSTMALVNKTGAGR